MDNLVTFILFLAVAAMIWMAIKYDDAHPPVCLKTTKVVSINSIYYRGASVTMSNGQTYDLYQATLKPGDDFCIQWKKY